MMPNSKRTHKPKVVPKIAYSLQELAIAVGLSEMNLRRRVVAGEIPATRIGKRILVRAADAETFLSNNMMEL